MIRYIVKRCLLVVRIRLLRIWAVPLLKTAAAGSRCSLTENSRVITSPSQNTGAAARTRETTETMLSKREYWRMAENTPQGIPISSASMTALVRKRHMLKNALIPIITAVGLNFGALLGGSVLTESIFAWPGVGRFITESIAAKDTPCVLASVVMLAITFTLINLLVDLLYAFADPRIKSQYQKARRVS